MGYTSDFRVLGDLAVIIDGDDRPITAARQRAALAMLLLAANRTISPVTLIEGIWGETLPQHPETALQIVVHRLRIALGPAAGRLTSGPPGYRITAAANELDLECAQSQIATGRDLLRADDPNGAADALDAALIHWTGEPLVDLVEFPFCPAARGRLRELRVSIYELRNDALLEAGRQLELLESIDEWTSAEPWRERIRAQHMLALYRAGRQVDALRAYDAYRARLIDELGVEPSDDLSELHRDILCHAACLVVSGQRTPAPARSVEHTAPCRGDEELLFMPRGVLRYARVAGDAAMHDREYSAAAAWYEAAMAASDDPRTRGEILIDLTDARNRAENQHASAGE